MKGYKIGDVATDFKLKNVDGKMFSLADIKGAKGYIIVFTCNECPFAKMYEDRLIALHKEYAPKGYSVVAINPNVEENNERESFKAMQKRAKEKKFNFVYLADTGKKIFPQYGALRTPHVFLLDKEFKVQYIGTIDDNAKSAKDVKVKFVENAIQAMEKGEKPNPNFTKAIGCPVKPI
ncbi:Peroxiredoxin [Spirosomataceae bacterium TFI 002]|nr:Peroxiredoxin [Spirosomataceae bacterium TFI 002]